VVPQPLNSTKADQHNSGQGLLLDDFLNIVQSERHALPAPNFRLKDVESYPGAALAVERIVQDIVEWRPGEILATPGPLLEELGPDIYGEMVKTAGSPRPRIIDASVKPVLRKALELALQTIVQLPSRDPREYSSKEYSSKRVLALASALSKLGEMVSDTLRESELRARIDCIFGEDPASRGRLMKVGEEMQLAGKALQTIAKTKARRVKTDIPNPQARWAVWFARCIREWTGRPHYALLATLLDAAFQSAGKPVPKWVGRLEIEQHREMTLRREWARSNTVRSIPPESSCPPHPVT